MSRDVCSLVLDTCDLLERSRTASARSTAPDLAAHAEVLRAELCAVLAACEDPAVAADGHAAVTELEALLARLDAGDGAPLALSA